MAGDLVFLKLCGIALDLDGARKMIIAGLKHLAAARPDDLFYVFCGGGAAVDALRARFESDRDGVCQEWYKRSGEMMSPEEAAHFLAIDIMDKNGSDLQRACRGVENLIIPTVSRLLREREGNLPRSWKVTSDSITYWLAVALACDPAFPRVILLKDVDGAFIVKDAPAGLPRRARDFRGKLVRRILVRGEQPRPALPSYPFDEFMFALVEEFQQPFYVAHWRRLEQVQELLEKGNMKICTKVMPG